MKRTKQAYYRPNPTHAQTQNLSGVTFVYGEDHDFYERTKQYQQVQKEFLEEQIKEKQTIKQQQNYANKMMENDLLQVNRLRGQLENEKHQRLVNMEKACDNFNLEQAEERKLREKQQRQQQLAEQRRQIQLLNQRNVKRYIPGKKN